MASAKEVRTTSFPYMSWQKHWVGPEAHNLISLVVKETIAGSRTAHLTSAFRNAFFSRLISLFNGKNGDKDASMELSTDFQKPKLEALVQLEHSPHNISRLPILSFKLISTPVQNKSSSKCPFTCQRMEAKPGWCSTLCHIGHFKLEANIRQLGIILSIFEIWQF